MADVALGDLSRVDRAGAAGDRQHGQLVRPPAGRVGGLTSFLGEFAKPPAPGARSGRAGGRTPQRGFRPGTRARSGRARPGSASPRPPGCGAGDALPCLPISTCSLISLVVSPFSLCATRQRDPDRPRRRLHAGACLPRRFRRRELRLGHRTILASNHRFTISAIRCPGRTGRLLRVRSRNRFQAAGGGSGSASGSCR